MVTTADDELAALCREYHDHGHENNPSVPRGRDTRRIHGFNFRMSELQGAVGGAQIAKLDWMVETNRRNYARIEQGIAGLDGLTPRRVPEACTPLCDTLIFELPDADTAARWAAAMGERGLGTKNLPDAIDWHFAGRWDHVFRDFGMDQAALDQATAPSRERLERAIAVPVLLKYDDAKIDQVVASLREIHAEVLG